MLGPVERGAHQLRHARVELGEDIAFAARVHHVHTGGHDGARVGHEEGPGLDLEAQGPAVAAAEGLELAAHVAAHVEQIHARLLGHAPHLEAPTQIDHGHVRKTAHDVEGHVGHALPDFRIGAGADMGVEPRDAQAVTRGGGHHLVEVLVPDPEARGGPAGVGALRRPAAQAWIDAYGDLAARRDLAVLVELVERARVEEDAASHVLGEPARGHLRGELDALGGKAGPERALHLEVARGVHVEAEIAEEGEDAVVRIGLHGVAEGEAVRRGKGEGLARRRLEPGAVVDVARGAEALSHEGGDLRGEPSGPARRACAAHRLSSFVGLTTLRLTPSAGRVVIVSHPGPRGRGSPCRREGRLKCFRLGC